MTAIPGTEDGIKIAKTNMPAHKYMKKAHGYHSTAY
jgi:hypothetical protein